MLKKILVVMVLCWILGEPTYTQTKFSATQNGVRKDLILGWKDSLKFLEPLNLPSYTEDSLTIVGDMMRQNDTLKMKFEAGIARLNWTDATDKMILSGDGRLFKPRTIASLGLATAELAGRRSIPFIWKESISAADSTRTDIYEIRGTGIIDSVTAIQVGASAVTFMLVKDSLATRRDCFSSNQTVNTTRTVFTSILYPNLATGFRFFIAIRTITGTMTWLKVQIFFHITS